MRAFARPSERSERLAQLGFEVAHGDVREADSVRQAAQGCDVVVHLAALYRSEGVPLELFRQINTEGTRNVVQACAQEQVHRLVHVSTVGVYGKLSTIPAAETHPYGPEDHYQRTKLEGELIVRQAAARELKGRVVIVRPTGVYGPGDRRFLKLFRAIAHGGMVIPGPAKAFYHPTYIDDFLDGMELMLTQPKALGQIYNLAGPRYMPMREYLATIARSLEVAQPRWHVPLWPLKAAAHVCEHVCRAIGVEPPIYPRRLGFFYFDRAFSTEKASRELGFSPRVELAEGACRTGKWFLDEGLI